MLIHVLINFRGVNTMPFKSPKVLQKLAKGMTKKGLNGPLPHFPLLKNPWAVKPNFGTNNGAPKTQTNTQNQQNQQNNNQYNNESDTKKKRSHEGIAGMLSSLNHGLQSFLSSALKAVKKSVNDEYVENEIRRQEADKQNKSIDETSPETSTGFLPTLMRGLGKASQSIMGGLLGIVMKLIGGILGMLGLGKFADKLENTMQPVIETAMTGGDMSKQSNLFSKLGDMLQNGLGFGAQSKEEEVEENEDDSDNDSDYQSTVSSNDNDDNEFDSNPKTVPVTPSFNKNKMELKSSTDSIEEECKIVELDENDEEIKKDMNNNNNNNKDSSKSKNNQF